MAQPAGFFASPALQLGVAEMCFLAQLRLNHVLLAQRKALGLGELQQVFQIQGLLQSLRQLGLLAGMGEERIELLERHRQTGTGAVLAKSLAKGDGAFQT
jgi:hypothetical protein